VRDSAAEVLRRLDPGALAPLIDVSLGDASSFGALERGVARGVELQLVGECPTCRAERASSKT